MNEFLRNIVRAVPSAYKKKGKKLSHNSLVVNEFLVIEHPLENSLFAKVCAKMCEAPPKVAFEVVLEEKELFLINCLTHPEQIVKVVSNCSL